MIFLSPLRANTTEPEKLLRLSSRIRNKNILRLVLLAALQVSLEEIHGPDPVLALVHAISM